MDLRSLSDTVKCHCFQVFIGIWRYTLCDISCNTSCAVGLDMSGLLSFFGVIITTCVCVCDHVCMCSCVCLHELWTTSSFHTQTDIKGGLN